MKKHKLKKIIKSFFYRGDDFQPPYFWITIFIILDITLFIMRLKQIGDISDKLLLGILGFVLAWLGIYNWDRKNKNGFKKVASVINTATDDTEKGAHI